MNESVEQAMQTPMHTPMETHLTHTIQTANN